MDDTIEATVVRIYGRKSIVGSGFFLNSSYVITCTHVITLACEYKEVSQTAPSDIIKLDFPLIEPNKKIEASVKYWDIYADIAGLELKNTPPSGVQPAQIILNKQLWNHQFRAYGFSEKHPKGVWVSGVIKGPVAGGWLQLEDVKEPGYQIRPGFSGGPVWDEKLGGVVGMIVAAELNTHVKAGYLIPASALVQALNAFGQDNLVQEDFFKSIKDEHIRMFEVALRREPSYWKRSKIEKPGPNRSHVFVFCTEESRQLAKSVSEVNKLLRQLRLKQERLDFHLTKLMTFSEDMTHYGYLLNDLLNVIPNHPKQLTMSGHVSQVIKEASALKRVLRQGSYSTDKASRRLLILEETDKAVSTLEKLQTDYQSLAEEALAASPLLVP